MEICNNCGKRYEHYVELMGHARREHGRMLEFQVLIENYGLPFKSINYGSLAKCINGCIDYLGRPMIQLARNKMFTTNVILFTCVVCIAEYKTDKSKTNAISALENKYQDLKYAKIIKITPNVVDILNVGYFIIPMEIISDLTDLSHEFAILRCLQGTRDLAIVIHMRAHRDLIKKVLYYFRKIYIQND